MTATLIPDRRPPLALLLVAALALFCALSYYSHSAPVPPAPKRLTEDMLVGTWRCDWEPESGGSLVLHADGAFARCPAPGAGAGIDYGTWHIDRTGAVVLTEYTCYVDFGYTSGPTQSRLTFDLTKYPRLVATSGAGKRVELKRQP